MFKLVVVALSVCYVSAYDAPVANPGSCLNGCGLVASKPFAAQLALPAQGLALDNGYGYGAARVAAPVGPITAAIQSTRSYEVVPVALNYEAPVPQTIDVPPNFQPLSMIWRTQSSPLNMEQIHTPAAPQHESTRSEDQPSVLTHESFKPVIQEFREVIQPQRKIEQKILPVMEHYHTIVAQGQEYRAPVAFATPVVQQFEGPLLSKGGYKKA